MTITRTTFCRWLRRWFPKSIGSAVGVDRQARFEDDASILSLPADYLSEEEAKDVVKAFLTTPFSDEVVHKRRLKKIEEYEN